MKNRAILIIPFLFLFSMALVSSANAVTLVTPAESESVSGATYVLNATMDSQTGYLNESTWFYDDGSANNTIATAVANYSALLFNTTWDSTGVVDIDSLTFWVNVTDVDGATYTMDSSTGAKVDNGNPTATLSSATFTDNTALVTGTSFTVGIDADSTIGISSCKVYYTSTLDSSTTTESVDASGNACSTTTTPTTLGLSINEAYEVRMEATDGNTNSTNATMRTLRVTPGSAGGGGGGSSSSTSYSNSVATGSAVSDGFFQKIMNWFRNLFNRN
jgi:hypothetical protein